MKNLEYLIVDEILKAVRKEKNTDPNKKIYLEKLDLKDLQPIFYKMLKGTKIYDFEKKVGYPSLLDMVDIDSLKNISVPLASKEILYTIFNQKIAEKIISFQEQYT